MATAKDPQPCTADISRIHQRLDEMFAKMNDVAEDVAEIKGRCIPCQKAIESLTTKVDGSNGTTGLITRVATLESGRTDTLSIKSVGWLIGIIGGLVGAIGTAIAVAAGRGTP